MGRRRLRSPRDFRPLGTVHAQYSCAMRICPQCSTLVPDNFRFCLSCGAVVPRPHEGHALEGIERFVAMTVRTQCAR
jgi:hypothetical protein